MTDFKARLSTVQRGLDTARGQAAGYTDPGLSADGLQARRQELDAAARAAAAPPLAALRAEVAAAAQTAADSASAALPKAGTNADATALTAAKWAQASMLLTAGKPMRDIIAGATDVGTLHALAEYGPSWSEAATYRAPTLGEALSPAPAPDHSALLRSIDQKLAEHAGPAAVAALAESNAAAGEAAYVAVMGERLDSLIAGTTPSSSAMSTALAAADAEQLAVNGQAPDDAPADAGATEDGAV